MAQKCKVIITTMASDVDCIACFSKVTARMHAVCCDGCHNWQHRQCKTGISTGITSVQYRQMVKGDVSITWHCQDCRMDVPELPVNSTVLSTASHLPTDHSAVDASPIRGLSETYIVRSDETEVLQPEESTRQPSVIEDRTWDLDGRDFDHPDPVLEASLPDRELSLSVPEEVPVTYEVVAGGSKRGGKKLVSSHGYTYTVRVTKGPRTYWTCSIRGKSFKCPASVRQFGDLYTASTEGHQHPADPGALSKTKVAVKVKEVARDNVFKPAGAIVEGVMKDMVSASDFSLPKPDNLIRAANRHRQKLRPVEPRDLEFEVDTDFIGNGFLKADVYVNEYRHLMFATDEQLSILSTAKRWFVDGTFKILKSPFYQLWTIHAFVKKGDDVKQVPLVYVLMSRRKKQDYIQVLQKLLDVLPEDPVLEWMMMDFEPACWQAVREVFPGTLLKGCVFHWNQRVYRKIVQEGLTTAYTSRGDKYTFLRKLMSLPYLPTEHIRGAYQRLLDQAEDCGGPVETVTRYVGKTWVDGSMWKPVNWSVFRETVRTNNDVEGWHRRIINRATRGDLSFYMLVPLLREEAATVDLQIRLVSENLLTRHHRSRYANLHGKLMSAWDQYEDDDISTTQLLRKCSQVAGLGPTSSHDPIHDNDGE